MPRPRGSYCSAQVAFRLRWTASPLEFLLLSVKVIAAYDPIYNAYTYVTHPSDLGQHSRTRLDHDSSGHQIPKPCPFPVTWSGFYEATRMTLPAFQRFRVRRTYVTTTISDKPTTTGVGDD